MHKSVCIAATMLIVMAGCGTPPGEHSRANDSAIPSNTATATTSMRPHFVYDTTPGARYVAEVWDTDTADHDATLAHALAATVGAAVSRGVLVLRAYNRQRVVRVTRWDSDTGVVAYAQDARRVGPRARYVEVLHVRSTGRKTGQPLAFDTTMAAQFSQFTLRRTTAVDTLQAMAAGMSSGMVQAEPTLRLISTLTAADSSVVAFLGVWDSPEGFEIFAERKTFSAKPYWEPYAGNEHHMMAVAAAYTRP